MASKTTTEQTTDEKIQDQRAHLIELGNELHNLFIKACRAIAIAKRPSGNEFFKIGGKHVVVNWGPERADDTATTIYVTVLNQLALSNVCTSRIPLDDHLYKGQQPRGYALWMTRNNDVIAEFGQMELVK